MITEETIARVKSSLQATKSFTALEVIEELKKENEQLKAYESHWEEIEEDAKVISKENAELKAKLNGALDICNIPEFRISELKKRNTELELQLKAAGERIDTLSSTNIELSNQIEKMKCCHNCKNCEVNFTNDSGIKYRCKKLRHKSDDCILNDYHYWELAE